MVIFLDENDNLIGSVSPGSVVLAQVGFEGFVFITSPEIFAVYNYADILDEAGSPHGATYLDTLNALCVFLNFQPGGGGSGEVNTASNVGAGDGVFKQKTGVDLEFKSFTAGTNITLTSSADEIQIDAAGGGESNTASNVGTGAGVFKQKTGVDLELRKVNSNDFAVTENANDITVNASTSMITNQSNVTPASGMQVLLEDSGTLKRSDVSNFLGGPPEIFTDNSFINTFDLSGQRSSNNTDINSYTGFASCSPFYLSADVIISRIGIEQRNASSVGLTAKIGIYEYISNAGAYTPPYRFNLVYQMPTNVNAAITGAQIFTLSPTVTLTGGKVYAAVVVHDTPTLAPGAGNKPTYFGARTLTLNNIIGRNPGGISTLGRTLETTTNAIITAGNLPSPLDFNSIGQGNFSANPYIYFDIINA